MAWRTLSARVPGVGVIQLGDDILALLRAEPKMLHPNPERPLHLGVFILGLRRHHIRASQPFEMRRDPGPVPALEYVVRIAENAAPELLSLVVPEQQLSSRLQVQQLAVLGIEQVA